MRKYRSKRLVNLAGCAARYRLRKRPDFDQR